MNPKLIAALAERSRLLANMGKRERRLADAGISTKAMRDLEALRAQPRPTTLRDVSVQNTQLRRLDKAQGLRSQTAGKAQAREQARAYNAQLREGVADPNVASRFNAQEMADAARLIRQDVARAARATENGYGWTPGTQRARELLERRPATRQQQLSFVTRGSKVLDYKTLTPEGAQEADLQSARAFGDDYKSFSRAERAAIWDTFHRAIVFRNIKSDVLIDMLEAARDDKPLQVVFTSDQNGNLVAHIDQTLDGARAQAAKAESEAAYVAEILARGSDAPSIMF